jgi:hypothetical protein
MNNKLRLANIALLVFIIIGCYIILSVGLQIFPTLPVNWSNDFISNFDNVILNLSYSFIAATIFYVLINYLPQIKKEKKFQPVIKRDINKIHSLFLDMINAMEPESKTHEQIPNYEEFENLMKDIDPKEKYPNTQGLVTEASYLKTFLYLKVESKEIISHIHLFKSYIPIEIISLLEELNDSRFFSDVVFFNSINNLSNQNMKMFAESFYDGFKIVKQLGVKSQKLYD